MLNSAKLIVLCLLFPITSFAQPVLPNPAHTPPDDCAAIAAMLKAPLPDLPGKKGDMATGSYGNDCDWKALNVKQPAVATAKSRYFFWFVKPSDPNNGQTRRIERDEGFGGKGPDEQGGTLVTGYAMPKRAVGSGDSSLANRRCTSGPALYHTEPTAIRLSTRPTTW